MSRFVDDGGDLIKTLEYLSVMRLDQVLLEAS